MCGLVGFLYNQDKRDSEISDQLLAMTKSTSHRGPDDDGFWINEKSKVALGHRRLSVILCWSSANAFEIWSICDCF